MTLRKLDDAPETEGSEVKTAERKRRGGSPNILQDAYRDRYKDVLDQRGGISFEILERDLGVDIRHKLGE